MTISARLKHHLDAEGIPYLMIKHPYAPTAAECAESAHVPGDHLAKSVLIHLEEGPMVAVVPSNHHVDLSQLQSIIDRRLGLAPEEEVTEVFDDCDLGAAPCIGEAYGVPSVSDARLTGLDQGWFDAGDHPSVVDL